MTYARVLHVSVKLAHDWEQWAANVLKLLPLVWASAELNAACAKVLSSRENQITL